MEPLRPGDKIYSPQFGRGEVLAVEGFGDGTKVRVQFEGGEVRVLHPEQFQLQRIEGEIPTGIPLSREANGVAPDAAETEEEMIQEEIRNAVRDALRDLMGLGETDLGGRWTGGSLVLRPGKEGAREKEVPLDAFFHKIVMVRDQLRVLEQKINAHPKLTDEEKVGLQHYITRCYGSLTTFNILFRDDEPRFGTEKE
jgi:hypothetical protein